MSHSPRPASTPTSPTKNAKDFAAIERAVTRIIGLTESRKPAGAARALVHPLDRAAYALLTHIGESSSIRLTELASTMGIDLSTASRQVRALEDRGLVARACDPDDQRTRWLNLSDLGRDALEDSRAVRIEVLRTRLTTWSAPDVAELARLLEQFIESFDTAPLEHRPSRDIPHYDAESLGRDGTTHDESPALSAAGGNPR
jgi:DNA-binding MarR family transcriptional regulator